MIARCVVVKVIGGVVKWSAGHNSSSANGTMRKLLGSVGEYVIFEKLADAGPGGEAQVVGYLVIGPSICLPFVDEAQAWAAANSLHDQHQQHSEQAHPTPQG